MTSLFKVGVLLIVGACVVPATASALPVVQADRACYSPGDAMELQGSGFTPAGSISVLLALRGEHGSKLLMTDPFPTDPGGAFRTEIEMPELASSDDRRERLFITANDQSKFGPEGPVGPPEKSFAAASLQVSQWDVVVASWSDQAADPRRVIRFDAFGWTQSKTLWAHYFRGTKRMKSVRIGALRGPCGDVRKRLRESPFRPVPPGTWTIYFTGSQVFDKQRPWVRYRNVRVAADKAVA